MEFGVHLPVSGPLANAHAIASAVLEADALGFQTAWVHDFIVFSRFLDRAHVSCGSLEAVESANGQPLFHESMTTLAYVAGLTRGRSIKLGLAVLALPLRNPIIAARQAANIDALSDGRLLLGVGVGAPKNRQTEDFEVLNISRAEKFKRTEEYLRTMLSIWTEDVSSFSGEYSAFKEIEFFPKPAQQPHPPIWVGGSSPRSLELLSRFGSGWIPAHAGPGSFPAKIEEIGRYAEKHSRVLSDITIGTGNPACIAPTRKEALRVSEKTLRSRTKGFPLSMEEVLDYSIVGAPEDVCEKIQEFSSAGVQHINLHFIYHSVEHLIAQLKLFSEKVIPEFS